MTIYGMVHYTNEDGPFMTVLCPDLNSYRRSIATGSRWAESEPGRPLGIRGVVCGCPELWDDEAPGSPPPRIDTDLQALLGIIGTDQTAPHRADADCTVNEATGCCYICGVDHSEPCPECAGRGFHLPTCPGRTAL